MFCAVMLSGFSGRPLSRGMTMNLNQRLLSPELAIALGALYQGVYRIAVLRNRIDI